MSISPLPSGALHRLLQDHQFALVAPHELERLPEKCRTRSIASAELKDSDALLPRLMDLTTLLPQESAALLAAFLKPVDEAGSPPVSVLLKSQALLEPLTAYLGGIQIAQSSAGQKAWLRMHDPRVWIQLHRILGMDALSGLMGPVDQWAFFLQGQWLAAERSKPPSTRLRFDAKTWAALRRIGIVNRTLARMQATPSSAAELVSQSSLIDELAQRAEERHRIARQEDLVEFCWLGVSVHHHFDEHPDVFRTLVSVKNDPSAFDELLAHDDSFWQNVRQTLNTKTLVRT